MMYQGIKSRVKERIMLIDDLLSTRGTFLYNSVSRTRYGKSKRRRKQRHNVRKRSIRKKKSRKKSKLNRGKRTKSKRKFGKLFSRKGKGPLLKSAKKGFYQPTEIQTNVRIPEHQQRKLNELRENRLRDRFYKPKSRKYKIHRREDSISPLKEYMTEMYTEDYNRPSENQYRSAYKRIINDNAPADSILSRNKEEVSDLLAKYSAELNEYKRSNRQTLSRINQLVNQLSRRTGASREERINTIEPFAKNMISLTQTQSLPYTMRTDTAELDQYMKSMQDEDQANNNYNSLQSSYNAQPPFVFRQQQQLQQQKQQPPKVKPGIKFKQTPREIPFNNAVSPQKIQTSSPPPSKDKTSDDTKSEWSDDSEGSSESEDSEGSENSTPQKQKAKSRLQQLANQYKYKNLTSDQIIRKHSTKSDTVSESGSEDTGKSTINSVPSYAQFENKKWS